MVQGVNSAQTSQATQQSLFATQSQQSEQTSATAGTDRSKESGGSVQQQAKISVLKESLETKESNVQKLLNSSQGVGQNIDTFA